MHIFRQKFISVSVALTQKNEIEKWPLITLVQCCVLVRYLRDGMYTFVSLQDIKLSVLRLKCYGNISQTLLEGCKFRSLFGD